MTTTENTLFASIRSSRHLGLSYAGRKIVQCGWKGLPSRDAEPEPEPEPPEPAHFGWSRSRSRIRRKILSGAGAGAGAV